MRKPWNYGNALMRKEEFRDCRLIYSMWEGYLPDVKPFWEKYGVPIIKVHSSGHAYIEELQDFVKAVKPKHIIPNHTFHPERYRELFDGIDVIELEDGQRIDLLSSK